MYRKPQAKRHRTTGLYDAIARVSVANKIRARFWRVGARAKIAYTLLCELAMDDDAVVDARLLAAVDCDQPVSRRFDLGVADFDTTFEMENSEPERTKACKGKTRLTLSLKKSRARSSGDAATPSAKRPRQALQPTNGRFNAVSESEYSEMAVPFVPSNTKKNDDWAYNNFVAWRDARNREHPENPCPEDLLYEQPFDVSALSYWLSRYACETRTRVGKKYPASTVYCLLGGLLRRLRAVSQDCPNFLDTSDLRFKEMHSIIDAYFRQLRAEGVGTVVKHATLISKEEENALWENGVLGEGTPTQLLNAVFYYNGKNLCLRGGKEHRALKLSQLVRAKDPDQYIYTENGSKNRSGGLYELRIGKSWHCNWKCITLCY